MGALQEEARAAGGQLVTLLGNHELMLIVGDYRSVCSSVKEDES